MPNGVSLSSFNGCAPNLQLATDSGLVIFSARVNSLAFLCGFRSEAGQSPKLYISFSETVVESFSGVNCLEYQATNSGLGDFLPCINDETIGE
jgi:hypothetical protein